MVAASDAGAEVFFAPNEKGAEKSNYKDALEAAKDIKTKMKVVPVDTLDDALMYLEKWGRNKKISLKREIFYRNLQLFHRNELGDVLHLVLVVVFVMVLV